MEYVWSETRARAIELFGAGPYEDTEDEILSVWKTAPAAVEAEIDAVGVLVATGEARSGWAVLRTRVKRITNRPDVRIEGADEGRRARQKASNWLKHAGLHYDRWTEVEDDLFDAPGAMLAAHADNNDMRLDVQAEWEELRPRGERAETEREQLDAKIRAGYAARKAQGFLPTGARAPGPRPLAPPEEETGLRPEPEF